MTKYVDFNWKVPVPQVRFLELEILHQHLNKTVKLQELLDGTSADKWIEEKDSADLELEAFFRLVVVVCKYLRK